MKTHAYANCQAIAAKVTPTDTTAAITLIGLSTQTDYQSPPNAGIGIRSGGIRDNFFA